MIDKECPFFLRNDPMYANPNGGTLYLDKYGGKIKAIEAIAYPPNFLSK